MYPLGSQKRIGETQGNTLFPENTMTETSSTPCVREKDWPLCWKCEELCADVCPTCKKAVCPDGCPCECEMYVACAECGDVCVSPNAADPLCEDCRRKVNRTSLSETNRIILESLFFLQYDEYDYEEAEDIYVNADPDGLQKTMNRLVRQWGDVEDTYEQPWFVLYATPGIRKGLDYEFLAEELEPWLWRLVTAHLFGDDEYQDFWEITAEALEYYAKEE